MNFVNIQIHKHESQSLITSIKNQQIPPYQSPLPNSNNGFPILALAVLGIMATAFLLVGYYIFVTKCCLNWQQFDPLRRFSFIRTQRSDEPLMIYSPSWQSRGLDELLIREIPRFQYTKSDGEERSLHKCVVCLNEFQENDTLKVLPSCKHGFHLDCIDIWLQSNDNCPLCRLSISGTTRYPIHQITAPNSSPQDSQPFISRGHVSSDEDFVVIELSQHQQEERNESREHLLQSTSRHHHSQRHVKMKSRKYHRASIMGDECINLIREKDDQFCIEPIRRSFSMDSAADRNVYLSVQEIVRQGRCFDEIIHNEECSSRIRKPFFSFGHVRGSRSSVLPIEF